MIVYAYSKINLGLDVIGKRDDGYHELRMIMQTLTLCDTLELIQNDDGGICMSCSDESLPLDDSNLCVKAAKLLNDEFNLDMNISINLTKRIPVAAGMAGGSADCAAVLIGLNDIYNLKLSLEDLCKRGVKLGADVPYCIKKGTALAEGIGDRLTKLPPMPDYPVLIAKPKESVSTGFVYKNLKIDMLDHPNIDAQIEAINDGNIEKICNSMGNVLETVTIPAVPSISKIKKSMIDNGAIGSMMSGSGPTVFGIFRDEKSLENAKISIEKMNTCNIVCSSRFLNV